MKNRHTRQLWMGALAALSIAASSTYTSFANASSHREAPAISQDPVADNTDLWAWVSKDHKKLYVVAAYNPLEEPGGGPNFHKFGDDVLYEIHITRGASSLDDVMTYQFRFSSNAFPKKDAASTTDPIGGGKEFFYQIAGQSQTYSITKIEKGKSPVEIAKDVKVAPANIGPRTNAVAYKANYDDAFAATFLKDMGTEGRVWAGPRDDGFYVDLGSVFDLAAIPGTSASTPRPASAAKDTVAGYNCHAITLEVPTKLLTGTGADPVAGVSGDASKNDPQTLGIWASASRRKVRVLRSNGAAEDYGPWVQVSRLGLPLINEAVIGLQDKDKYNRTKPGGDVTNFGAYFLNPVIVKDAEAVGVYGAPGTKAPDALRTGRTDILDLIGLKAIPAASSHNITAIGDVLRVDMGFDSGFPNGRPLVDYSGTPSNKEPADVTDILVSYLLTKATSGVSDNVNKNDKNYLTDVPFLALPWEGYTDQHGKLAP